MQISKDFKLFGIKIFVLLLLLFAIDCVFGTVMSSLEHKDSNIGYIMDECKYDLLIFGSSRAKRHYNPQIIEDSLCLSCYNCGQDAMGIILNNILIRELYKRYEPKLIVYDIYPPLDLVEYCDNHVFIGNMRSYMSRPTVSEVINNIDKYEKVKMLSNLYKYNSKFKDIVNEHLNFNNQKYNDNINGFLKKESAFDIGKVAKGDVQTGGEIDTIKLYYLKKVVECVGKDKLLFCISPRWYGMDGKYIDIVKQFCNRNSVPLIDFSSNSKYVKNNIYFCDGIHLNGKGADEFTKDFVKELKILRPEY